MTTEITQALVDKAAQDHQSGAQIYDQEVAGLRVVVGKKSCSYKLVGRINDGTDRCVSIIIGRTNQVGQKTVPRMAMAMAR